MSRGVPSPGVRLGFKENWRQFALLVLVNAFVGGMVGLERTVVPLIGSEQFGLVLKTAIFSFIASFGLVMAFSNLVSGSFADRFGRWLSTSVQRCVGCVCSILSAFLL